MHNENDVALDTAPSWYFPPFRHRIAMFYDWWRIATASNPIHPLCSQPLSSAFSTARDSELFTVGHSSSLKVKLELARFYSRILFTFDNCLTRFNPTGNNRNSVTACTVPDHERSLCNSWHVNGQRNFRICRLIISYKRADTKLISLVQFILLFVA